MGMFAYSVGVAGAGTIDAARADLWREARRSIGSYLGGRAHTDAWEYLDSIDPRLVVDNAGHELYWTFPDLGGLCATSAGMWAHWMGLVFAIEWDRFAVRLSDRHGLTLTGPRPDLGDLLTHTPRTYVEIDEHLWHLQGDHLYGDGRDRPVAELSVGLRVEVVDPARERCRCPLCIWLRPDDPALANWLLDEMEGFDAPAARLAAWKLVNMHQTWPNVLLALIDAAGVPENRDTMVELIDRYAPRLPDARSVVESYLPELTAPGTREVAERFLAQP